MIFARDSRALRHLPFFISLCGNPAQRVHEDCRVCANVRLPACLPVMSRLTIHIVIQAPNLLMLLREKEREREKISPSCYCRCHHRCRSCRYYRCRARSLLAHLSGSSLSIQVSSAKRINTLGVTFTSNRAQDVQLLRMCVCIFFITCICILQNIIN